MPDQPRNRGHVNDPKLTAMAQEQRRTKDPEARQKILADFQRYAAEQQFNLDEAFLDDLKEELIYGQQLAVDEAGKVLV